MHRKLLYTLLFIIVASIIALYLCNKAIIKNAEGKLYDDVQQIPYRKTALVLGTSRDLNNGYMNPYYRYRIEATTALYKAGKIKYIIVSVDNSHKDYNEPKQMRDDLISNGVDSTHIFLDYAGFRTFDSMVRLREIFSQDSVTIISQQFHNERALYIAHKENINAIAFNAKDVSAKAGFRTQLREKFARVKVFVDYLTNKSPKYLGDKVIIPK